MWSVHRVAVWGMISLVVIVVFQYIRQRNDPLSLYHTAYQPTFSTRYFAGMREFDPISYDDAMHTMTEFSRLYQTSFLIHQDMRVVIKHMSRQRRLLHRHLHTLRGYLPNDTSLEKRLLLGLEHTDGGMAWCLEDVTRRHPSTRLLHGAGVVSKGPRSVDDVWS